MGRKLTLLLIHGMGEQKPHQLTDTFARNLADGFRQDGKTVKLGHHVDGVDDKGRPDSHVRMEIDDDQGAADSAIESIDLHEVYWADKPQGLIKLKEVGRWLWRTSMTPLLRWPQNASLFHNPNRPRSLWAKVREFLREVMLAVLLPAVGIGLLVFTLTAAGIVDGYVRAVRKELGEQALSGWIYVFGVVFAVLVVSGLFLLLGSLRIDRTVRYEMRQSRSDAHTDRWSWLGRWSTASAGAGVVLLIVAWVVHQAGAVEDLVAIVLRLGDESFGRVVWAALWLALTVGMFIALVVGLWKLPKRGWGRVLRAVGLLAGAAGVVVVIIVLVAQLELAAKVVLWGTGIVGAMLVSWFLVKSIGDVAIYFDGIDERSRHHATRQAILEQTTGKLRRLLREGTEVYVAAHSLGSAIAYDTINSLATGQRAPAAADGSRPLQPAEFNRLRGFYSFGSPLDKVVYLFHKTTSSRTPVLSQIQSSLTSFRRRSSERPYGPYEFERYTTHEPDGFRWRNAWSWGDVLGHRLDFYRLGRKDDDEEDRAEYQPHFDYIPLVAHSGFWKDPEFYSDVREFIAEPES